MPSPFPGMDPYLESPDIWFDFHHSFAVEISAELNHVLPQNYYARLGERPEMGDDAPLRHLFVEIRDAKRGHALITLIEIASPSNKRPGADRRTYKAKQREILESDASLIEFDLLRAGQPLVAAPAIRESAVKSEPRLDYMVTVNRAWQRGAKLVFELFPVRLDESLPCIPVPLREKEQETVLNLQFVFDQAYDGGPYARGAVDYDAPPDPVVRTELAQWLNDCVKRWRKPRKE
jgi:hypothetical protein